MLLAASFPLYYNTPHEYVFDDCQVVEDWAPDLPGYWRISIRRRNNGGKGKGKIDFVVFQPYCNPDLKFRSYQTARLYLSGVTTAPQASSSLCAVKAHHAHRKALCKAQAHVHRQEMQALRQAVAEDRRRARQAQAQQQHTSLGYATKSTARKSTQR